MNRTESVNVFYCDCCGERIGIEAPNRHIDGVITSRGEVVFEPIVFGDYCEDCFELAQSNWKYNGISSVCSDRHDMKTESLLLIEIGKMNELYDMKNGLDSLENWR